VTLPPSLPPFGCLAARLGGGAHRNAGRGREGGREGKRLEGRK